MICLLDTHVWIQRALGERLPPLVDRTLAENPRDLALANISLWEAAKLVELGRLELAVSMDQFFQNAITPELTILPVTPAVAIRATSLEATGFHKDPADQLIVATALVHQLRLVTNDHRIQQWGGVPTLWKSPRG